MALPIQFMVVVLDVEQPLLLVVVEEAEEFGESGKLEQMFR